MELPEIYTTIEIRIESTEADWYYRISALVEEDNSYSYPSLSKEYESHIDKSFGFVAIADNKLFLRNELYRIVSGEYIPLDEDNDIYDSIPKEDYSRLKALLDKAIELKII